MPGVLATADAKSSSEMSSKNDLKSSVLEEDVGVRGTEPGDEDKGERVSSPDVDSGTCVCVWGGGLLIHWWVVS